MTSCSPRLTSIISPAPSGIGAINLVIFPERTLPLFRPSHVVSCFGAGLFENVIYFLIMIYMTSLHLFSLY